MSRAIIENTYIGMIAARLKNFSRVREGVYHFTHDCERQDQTRGYFLRYDNHWNFYCHNCGESIRFETFLKRLDSELWNEMRFELFNGQRSKPILSVQPNKVVKESNIAIQNIDIGIPIAELENAHVARQYLEQRRIPTKYWYDIYWQDKFLSFAKKYDASYEYVKDNDPRILLPYYTIEGRLYMVYGRTLNAMNRMKYRHVTIDPCITDKLYGLNRINQESTIYVCEGQFDSLMIDNGIAVGGSNKYLKSAFIRKHKDRVVIIPDTDYKRNTHIMKSTEKLINSGYKVSLIGNRIRSKDLNQFVVEEGSRSQLYDIINSSIYGGLRALTELKFQQASIMNKII